MSESWLSPPSCVTLSTLLNRIEPVSSPPKGATHSVFTPSFSAGFWLTGAGEAPVNTSNTARRKCSTQRPLAICLPHQVQARGPSRLYPQLEARWPCAEELGHIVPLWVPQTPWALSNTMGWEESAFSLPHSGHFIQHHKAVVKNEEPPQHPSGRNL